MGITGLLPALRSISTQRHLSEFAGQTIGVDAYVWLHRGVFTCATQLATGKQTTKYVDYAMHRVRLLRHHGIEPYIVFDGGPLPAKKGTEGDRQARRAEHLALGNALAAQGRSAQAREHYVKCIDVTPQMAKQLIKALRAENVQYVVAPYEADAQLAYLEMHGFISGIITEDSDLLVFGCRNVLYKMDAVSATADCISQDDFPRITSSVDGISLHGFSLAQFRAMAILSGCDYLPSIPGIGLKTACSLLRKWRTTEQVVRSIRMEGKKSVPRGYLEQFRLAEKCFLHQRVYNPTAQCLVHLTEPEEGLDETANVYVGPDMDPTLAKRIAIGDADPITLKPMADICPDFIPRALKPLPFVVNGVGRQPSDNKGKGKAVAENGTLLNFFAPKSKSSVPPRALTASKTSVGAMVVGKASGKRTLAEEMDRDIAVKRKKYEVGAQSKFFPATASQAQARTRHELEDLTAPVAGPSRFREKENVPLEGEEDGVIHLEEEDMDADLQWDSLSLVATAGADEIGPEVEQEDGYFSPTPSCSRDTEELSSPARRIITPGKRIKPERELVSDDLDVVSSPPPQAPIQRLPSLNLSLIRQYSRPDEHVLVAASPDQESFGALPRSTNDRFGDGRTSDIDCFDDSSGEEDDWEPPLVAGESATPTPSPPTPSDMGSDERAVNEARAKIVAAGWRDRWALPKDLARSESTGGLRRRETTVTPNGRHFPINRVVRGHPYHADTPNSVPSKMTRAKTKPLQSRRSLTFLEPPTTKSKGGGRVSSPWRGLLQDHQEPSTAHGQDAVANRFAHFRCPS